MAPRNWQNGPSGGTPLAAEWLNGMEADILARLLVWQPNTPYLVGVRVASPNGDVVVAKETHTSAAAYEAAKWALSSSFVQSTARGAVNGIASLDGNGKIPAAQVPAISAFSQYGLFANRPSAAGLAGVTYYTSDTQEQYRSDGTNWVVAGPGGSDLGSTEMTVWFLTTSQTSVDVTGMTVTFVAPSRPVVIRFDGDLSTSAGNIGATATILLDGAAKAEVNAFFPYADKWETKSRAVRIAGLVPGSTHTAKLQLKAVGTGTARIDGNANKLSQLTVTGS